MIGLLLPPAYEEILPRECDRAYREAKVYRDGYHYVAIPYKENSSAKKRGGVTDLKKDEKKKALGRYQRQIK